MADGRKFCSVKVDRCEQNFVKKTSKNCSWKMETSIINVAPAIIGNREGFMCRNGETNMKTCDNSSETVAHDEKIMPSFDSSKAVFSSKLDTILIGTLPGMEFVEKNLRTNHNKHSIELVSNHLNGSISPVTCNGQVSAINFKHGDEKAVEGALNSGFDERSDYNKFNGCVFSEDLIANELLVLEDLSTLEDSSVNEIENIGTTEAGKEGNVCVDNVLEDVSSSVENDVSICVREKLNELIRTVENDVNICVRDKLEELLISVEKKVRKRRRAKFTKKSECQLLCEAWPEKCSDSDSYPRKRSRNPLPNCYASEFYMSFQKTVVKDPVAAVNKQLSKDKHLDITPEVKVKTKPKFRRSKKKKLDEPVEHYLDVYMRALEAENLDKSLSQSQASEDLSTLEANLNLDSKESDSIDNLGLPTSHSEQPILSPVRLKIPPVSVDSDRLESSTKRCLVSPSVMKSPEVIIPPISSILPTIDILSPVSIKSEVAEEKVASEGTLASDEGLMESIDRVLGMRESRGLSELLVLFKDGTSNWTAKNSIEKEGNIKSVLESYFADTSKCTSPANRLLFELFCQSNKSDNFFERVERGPILNFTDFFEKPLAPSQPANSPELITCAPMPNKSASTDYNAANQITMLEDGFISSKLKDFKDSLFSSKKSFDTFVHDVSSRHVLMYPCDPYKLIVVKKDVHFFHIFLQPQTVAEYPRKKVIIDEPSVDSIKQLIDILEECSHDATCKAIVMNGVENFFGMASLLTKLIKKQSALEDRDGDDEVSVLR